MQIYSPELFHFNISADCQFKFTHYTDLLFPVKRELEVTSQVSVLQAGALKDGVWAEAAHKSHNLLHSLVSR